MFYTEVFQIEKTTGICFIYIYDLEKERAKVVEAILDSGHIPVGMELLGGANTITSTIKKMIDASDIFFLLIGGNMDPFTKKRI